MRRPVSIAILGALVVVSACSSDDTPSSKDRCDAAPPATWDAGEPLEPIDMVRDPITATVTAVTDRVCPGGSTTLTLTFRNDGDAEVVIDDPRPTMRDRNGTRILATLDDVTVAPGDTVSVEATVRLPLVAPGEYALDVDGFAAASPGIVVGVPDADAVPFEQRAAELRAFEPKPWLAGEQCGVLSASDGVVQVVVAGGDFARAAQQRTPVNPGDLLLKVRFGSGFPAPTCNDVETDEPESVIDETWWATTASGTFTVVAGPGCSVATLELIGVIAHAPTGGSIPLGDLTITNSAWMLFPPNECQLNDPPPG